MSVPPVTSPESFDFETLLALAERIALEKSDGHLTLMRFTTGWKCMIGTPNIDVDGRTEVGSLKMYDSAKSALMALICDRRPT